MKVKIMQVGPLGTNCYFLMEEEEKVLALIDPGDDAKRIQSVADETGCEVKYILLTHGHYDHTTAVPELHKAYPDAQIYIHAADANGAGSKLYPLASQVEDLKHYTEIMDFLSHLNKQGVTVVLITHDMHLMLEYTPRAIVFNEGKVIADMSAAQVLNSPEIVEAAHLKETSLYHLSGLCGIADPEEFTRRFIARDREVRV